MVNLKDGIINDVVENVRYRAKRFYNVTLTENSKEKIRDFLQQQDLNNEKVRVIFKSDIPEGNYTSIGIINNDSLLRLTFGKNNRKEEYPNILFVYVVYKGITNFCNFWTNRQLPVSLLPNTLLNISLVKKVEIEVLQDIEKWEEKRKTEKNASILLSEKEYVNNIDFIEHLHFPIGYAVIGKNKVVLALQNKKLKNGYAHYTFR